MKKIKKITIEYTDESVDNFVYEYVPTTAADEEEPCLIRDYFRRNPDASSVLISCPCKRCSVQC